MSRIKHPELADDGKRKVEWAKAHMKVLSRIRERLVQERPLKGERICACLHLEAKTAVLLFALRDAGAMVFACGSNPLSTQDDVVAYLAKEGIEVFSWRGMTTEEYFSNIREAIEVGRPSIVIDDGADLIATLVSEYPQLVKKVKGASEETTTGVIRLKAMAKEGVLPFPVFATNDAFSKYLFDNRYGTGQSTWDGIMRATNLTVAGKVVVVAGYGWCGRGIAARARGLGARVIVTEVSPFRALEALHDGFEVMKMEKAAPLGDIFVTATGCRDVITKRHIELMKDGAVLANAGHFNVEVSVKDLEEMAESTREVLPYVKEYRLKSGKRIYLLAEGRLVNLVVGSGHPVEIMDMSFSLQALVVKFIKDKGKDMPPGVHKVPPEIDEEVAQLKLETMGVSIDELSSEQKRYLESWRI